MKYLCTICFLLTVVLAHAQYNPEKVDKKSAQLYSKALEIAQNNDFPQSIRILEGVVKTNAGFEDAWLSLAGMYGELKNYQSAIAAYEKARAIDSNYFKDYNLPYSINLAGKGEFQRALVAVNEFLSIPNLNETSLKAGQYRKRSYEFAVKYANSLAGSSYRFEPQNLGDSINTKDSEYYPTLTIDNKELVFTRRVNNFNEDFYGSSSISQHWSKAKGLSGNINSAQNEGAQNISQDGQWLIFTGCNFPDGYGSCDLYISYLSAEGWSAPQNMGNRINTEYWESAPSLSPDKQDLYFASRRPGGYGGSDIYISHRLPSGRWTEPENAGPQINTAGDESTPFIHADNHTLYFTSNGHIGYGGDDLYLVHKGPNNTWSAAKNLGYPINTIENEGSLIVAADGETAYYASDRSDSRGGLDLYTFNLRSDVRPVKTLWIKGRVFDKNTTKGLPSGVELTDLVTKEVTNRVQTDERGNYLITLPVGRDYAFNVNRKGYLFYSENFPLSQKTADSTYNIDIPLQPLEANAIVVLKNIFFDVNKFDLRPESQIELNRVVALLKENPQLTIQINGHTDNAGKPADNLKLSNDRAQAVVSYLISQGIPAKRLLFKGFGATQPVADNKTEEGKAQNRRTELKVITN
ncbi:MAG: OmpA family protein [Williamsia sp.]|nr:OmpA family protein [Williamsia sp.]